MGFNKPPTMRTRSERFYEQMLMARVKGAPALPITPAMSSNPLNPNQSPDDGCSGAGSKIGLDRVPQRAAPVLRLVYRAP